MLVTMLESLNHRIISYTRLAFFPFSDPKPKVTKRLVMDQRSSRKIAEMQPSQCNAQESVAFLFRNQCQNAYQCSQPYRLNI